VLVEQVEFQLHLVQHRVEEEVLLQYFQQLHPQVEEAVEDIHL
jgi:hypothetical protein